MGVSEEYGYTRNDGTAYCKGRFLESLLAAPDHRQNSGAERNTGRGGNGTVRKFAVEPDDPARKIDLVYI